MSTQDPHPDPRFLAPRMERTARDLALYCARERERRENSGDPFDAARFDEAVELAKRRLETTEPGRTA